MNPRNETAATDIKDNPALPPDNWPLQADRLAIRMPLVDCLLLLAGHYGRRTSAAALTAGLPVPKSGITPEVFVRAAERADLNAKLADRSLESLAIAPNLPCILALEHAQACILWDIRYPEKHPPKKDEGKDVEIHPETKFLVQFPETPDDKRLLTLDELRRLYIGYAFFVRPVAEVAVRGHAFGQLGLGERTRGGNRGEQQRSRNGEAGHGNLTGWGAR